MKISAACGSGRKRPGKADELTAALLGSDLRAEESLEDKNEKVADNLVADDRSKYQCGPCGYLYDPEKGDPEHGIQPGTSFARLPEDWTCPTCGAPKSQFNKL